MDAHYDVWELSAFLDELGAKPPARNEGVHLAYHSSCHLLRELGVDHAPKRRARGRDGAAGGPLLFAKWPNAVIGDGEAIVIPVGVEQVDNEAELAASPT